MKKSSKKAPMSTLWKSFSESCDTLKALTASTTDTTAAADTIIIAAENKPLTVNKSTVQAMRTYRRRNKATRRTLARRRATASPIQAAKVSTVSTGLYSRDDVAAVAVTLDTTKERTRKPSSYQRQELNIWKNPDDIGELAKIITVVTAKNAVSREGTKTQQDIYRACCAHEWTHPDVADIVQVAALSLWETVSMTDIQALKREIAVLEKSVEMLKPLNLTIDYTAVQRIIRSGKKYSRRITADYNRNKSAAEMLKHSAAAVELARAEKPDFDKATGEAAHAAFLAVNAYLSSMRSIRVEKSFLSLDDIADYYGIDTTDSMIDRIEPDTEKTAKRRLYLSAFTDVKDLLTKSQISTYKLLIKGYTVNQIADKRGLGHSTVCDHKQAIAAAFLSALQTAENADTLTTLQDSNTIILDVESAAAVIKNAKTVKATTEQSAEIAAIRNAVNDDIRAAIEKYSERLQGTEKMVYCALSAGKTERETVAAIGRGKGTVNRVKGKLQADILDIIEYQTGIVIDREKLSKMPLVKLVSLFR